MDRKAWLAVSLSTLGLIAYYWYTFSHAAKQPPLPAEVAAAATPTPEAASPEVVAPTPTPAPERSPLPVKTEELVSSAENEQATYLFNNDTGGIQSVILKMHLGEDGKPIRLNGDASAPIGALYSEPGVAEMGFEMTADREHSLVTFARTDADGLVIEKKFTLPGGDSKASPYVAQMELTFRNASAKKIERKGYFLGAGTAAPVHEKDLSRYTQFDWERRGKMKSITTDWFNARSIPLIGIQTSPEKEIFEETDGPIEWISVSSQYFSTLLVALDAQGVSVWGTRFELPPKESGKPVYGIRGELGMSGFSLDPGNSITQKFEIYAGPKELARLESLGHGEQAVLNFGMFGFVSKFLLWAMTLLHNLLGNYAAAIIVLTLLIKSALWPIQNKATQSMRRMSLLSPKMTELREKYKDDPTKMNEELMKLYRDYGVNPFSGCLPMLIQIPIFFGFYTMLGSAIELRNSSFLWIHDLSQPDTVFTVHFPFPLPLLGTHFPINVLPLIMAGTMVWQMRITPKTGDPSQQRILMFMPVIFVLFAYNYASALSLYWTTQNLFSIVQLYLTRNRPLPTLEKVSVAKKKAAAQTKSRKRTN